MLGHLSFGTSTIFDIGVYLVVIGLVLDILRSLGSEIDRQSEVAQDNDDDGGTDDAGSCRSVRGASGCRRRRKRDGHTWRAHGIRCRARDLGGDPMSASLTLVIVMAVMYAAGVYVMLERSLTRVLIGFLLVGNATNLLILIMSGRPGSSPIVTGTALDDAWPTRCRRR